MHVLAKSARPYQLAAEAGRAAGGCGAQLGDDVGTGVSAAPRCAHAPCGAGRCVVAAVVAGDHRCWGLGPRCRPAKCRPGSEERRGVARLRAAPRNQASAGLSMDDWWVARAWGVGVGQTPPRLRAPRKSGPKCALNYSAPAPTPVWVRRPGTWPLGHVRSGRAMGVDVPRRPGRHAAPDNVEA